MVSGDITGHGVASPVIFADNATGNGVGAWIALCDTAVPNSSCAVGSYGTTGDIALLFNSTGPAPGHANFSVFRPSTGTWYISNGKSTVTTLQYGQSGDIPIPADYTGSGQSDFALWRPSNATWYIRGVENVVYGNPY